MVKERGRYYELPIIGSKIKRIIFAGLSRLVFDDPFESLIELDGEFEIERYNQTITLHPNDKEALMLFYDLFQSGTQVKDAIADRSGRLFLKFDNGFVLTVEDGPFENWHFTGIDKQNPKNNWYMHGGIGRTVIIG